MVTTLLGAEQRASREPAGVWKDRKQGGDGERAPCVQCHWASVPPASLPRDCELRESPAPLCALSGLQLLKGLVPWKVSSPGLGRDTLPQTAADRKRELAGDARGRERERREKTEGQGEGEREEDGRGREKADAPRSSAL